MSPGDSVVIATDFGVWYPGTVTEVTAETVKLDSDKAPHSFEIRLAAITDVRERNPR